MEASSRISIKALKALLKGLYEVILDSRTNKGDMWRFRDLCLTYCGYKGIKMKVRYRVVPKQNSKPAFYVNCDDKQVTIQAADSAFKTLVSLQERLAAWYKEKIFPLIQFLPRQLHLALLCVEGR